MTAFDYASRDGDGDVTETIRAGTGPGFEISDEITARLSKPDTGRGRLQRAALALLCEHHDAGEIPTNGRFVFYELEGRGIVRKSVQGQSRRGTAVEPREQEVTDALMHLRESGVVPYWWIEDETRSVDVWLCAETVEEYMGDRLDEARINPWGKGKRPLLLVESRSLRGVLRNLASRYLVDIAPTNGQVGGFLRTEIAPLLKGNKRPVFYLGDYDLQADQIEANTRDVLERETGRKVEWRRIAITKEQVNDNNLKPILKTDNRYGPRGPDGKREGRAHWAVECEALGQSTVVNLVQAALDALLPQPLTDVLEREQVERKLARYGSR